jgi:hypothetical protein
LTPDADGPEVAVEAMASGAMLHPCEIFLFCIMQRMWLGNNAVCPEIFSRQKSKTPFLTWTVFNANNRALFLF